MKTLLLACLLLAATSGRAQTSIQGIGDFKLGRSIAQVLDSVKPMYGPPVDIEYTPSMSQANDNHIYKIVSSKYGPAYSYFTKCPRYDIYYAPWYDVASLAIKKIRLLFHDSTLVSITSDMSSQIADAIDLKYGKSTVDFKKGSVSCIYTYTGAKVEKETIEITRTWRRDDIAAYAYSSMDYDSKCELRLTAFFICEKQGASEELRKCESNLKESESNREKEILKTKLDKL